MVTDPVGDALIRIKNGYMAKLPEVSLGYSKLIVAICKVLKDEGFVDSVKEESGKVSVTLKYENRKSVLTDVKRISKPGLRVYKGKKNLPYVLNGLGIALISTPKGVMTDKKARKEGLGGEIMAYVW